VTIVLAPVAAAEHHTLRLTRRTSQ